MIEINNISKVFRTSEVETVALNHVSLDVKEGEFVAIMGPSGCGKSTLLNILGLLDNPTEGSYKLLGQEVADLKEKERTRVRKGKLGFVFQSFNLIDELNVYENVELPHALRENLRYFLQAVMPVCDEYGINMCIHPDDPPFQVLGLPRIVTSEKDITWLLHAVDNSHNGLTFCAGSLSAGLHNNVPSLARMFAHRTHFVHLRSTNAFPNGNFIEASHLGGRAHVIELIRIFEKERPGVPMRVDHGRMMLDDAGKGYNPGYSFHGRMMALAQIEGMMAVINEESKLKS